MSEITDKQHVEFAQAVNRNTETSRQITESLTNQMASMANIVERLLATVEDQQRRIEALEAQRR